MSTKNSKEGHYVWVIPDGDLPPAGKGKLKGHEALIILNTSEKDVKIELEVFFEDKKPDKKIKLFVPAERVKCFRLDKPLGDSKYKIPFGQYALRVKSNVPVIVQFGRLDVRQPNLAYYCTMAYPVR